MGDRVFSCKTLCDQLEVVISLSQAEWEVLNITVSVSKPTKCDLDTQTGNNSKIAPTIPRRVFLIDFTIRFFPLHRHNPGQMRDGRAGRQDLRLD